MSIPLWAQGDTSNTGPVEMADKFRADGKIYVVVAVVLVILLGIFVYVARLDRKITTLEKELK
jgi:CcmD family protein